MPHVTFLALPDALSSSLSLPMEMLAAADQLAQARHRQRRALDRIVVGDGTTVTTASGLRLPLDADWRSIETTDLLIVPSLWRDPRTHLRRHRHLLPWLRQLAAGNALLCAVGTGSFLLAEAGLLEGRAATTHWFYFDQFAAAYPTVALKRRHLITQAGNLFCAGSVNSVADLTISFVARFYGRQVARGVEAQFSPEIRRPVEHHAFNAERADVHGDELVIEMQELLLAEPGGVRIAAVAAKLGISVRTLNRRFRQATGMCPQAYIHQQKLHDARELLRTSNLSITEVAAAVGYTDRGYFARLFQEHMKQSPREYRRAVRGKLFSLQT